MRSNIKQAVPGFLLLGMFILGIFFISGCVGQEEEVVAEHPLDGVTLEFGNIHASAITANERHATEIACEEINAYAQSLGIDFKMVPLFEATEGSDAKVVEKFDSLVARGVKFVTGFWWSSSVRLVLEKANEQKILLISAASTAMDLAIEDDYCFRMPVTDVSQGPAMAKMILDYDVEAVVAFVRGDTWGDGLYGFFEDRWLELGGKIVEKMRYDPEKTEFGAEAELLDGYVSDAIEQYGQDKVGLLYVGFDVPDGVGFFSAAANYPTLMSVTWFGTDGHETTPDPIREVGQHMVKVRHVGTLMGIAKTQNYFDFAAKFDPRYGAPATTYETCQYDSVWILGKAILESASIDPEVVKEAVPIVAETYFGASGWCRFNEAGDRAGANFDIWAVLRPEESPNPAGLIPDANSIGWEIIGVYNPSTDMVTWNREFPLPLG